MTLELMYITNRPDVATIAQSCGVDRIWIDLETLGKAKRQKNMDSVKSNHTLDDIKLLRPILRDAKLHVRVNPINENSIIEIDAAIKNGADILMLPMFKSSGEVKKFIEVVNSRAKTSLLLETKEAHSNIDEILNIKGIDEIHIGLNDLHLSYGKKFMFELLIDGTVEDICKKIKNKNIPYGFGGIARIGYGDLPAEYIIAEHYRLNSKMVILSRSFCNYENEKNLIDLEKKFRDGIKNIRNYENELKNKTSAFFEMNYSKLCDKIFNIVNRIN